MMRQGMELVIPVLNVKIKVEKRVGIALLGMYQNREIKKKWLMIIKFSIL